MEKEKCKICDNLFSQKSGHFTLHLKNDHNLTLEDYIVITEFKGVHPKCQCGFCDDNSHFDSRIRKFTHINYEHKNHDWLKEQWIKKFGVPKCHCGNDVNWTRGKPNKYCNFKCLPNRWNQKKIKETVQQRYQVNNVSQDIDVKEKIKNSLKPLRKIINEKSKITKKIRYKNGHFDDEKMKQTILHKYGVEHPSQILKNREKSSIRMIENNPMFDEKNMEKMVETRTKKYESGELKYYNTKKYNDFLYYQGLYEKHFLDLCNEIGIIDEIQNGHSFEYLECDNKFGYRTLTDFSYKDFEIEIKSKWILEKQGGFEKIEAKRRSVENKNKKYILILDKDYTEFFIYINKYK